MRSRMHRLAIPVFCRCTIRYSLNITTITLIVTYHCMIYIVCSVAGIIRYSLNIAFIFRSNASNVRPMLLRLEAFLLDVQKANIFYLFEILQNVRKIFFGSGLNLCQSISQKKYAYNLEMNIIQEVIKI